jgi:hypothetical protein
LEDRQVSEVLPVSVDLAALVLEVLDTSMELLLLKGPPVLEYLEVLAAPLVLVVRLVLADLAVLKGLEAPLVLPVLAGLLVLEHLVALASEDPLVLEAREV